MIIVFVGYYLVSTAPATLPLRQGGVPAGGGGGYKFLHFVIYFFVLIHPLRFARPPVSGGQSAGAVRITFHPNR